MSVASSRWGTMTTKRSSGSRRSCGLRAGRRPRPLRPGHRAPRRRHSRGGRRPLKPHREGVTRPRPRRPPPRRGRRTTRGRGPPGCPSAHGARAGRGRRLRSPPGRPGAGDRPASPEPSPSATTDRPACRGVDLDLDVEAERNRQCVEPGPEVGRGGGPGRCGPRRPSAREAEARRTHGRHDEGQHSPAGPIMTTRGRVSRQHRPGRTQASLLRL